MWTWRESRTRHSPSYRREQRHSLQSRKGWRIDGDDGKFLSKSKNFLSEGKLAVGIKFTKDSMEIVEHIGKIGYVLFHTRKDTDQHLYSIKGDCKILPAEELEAGTYKVSIPRVCTYWWSWMQPLSSLRQKSILRRRNTRQQQGMTHNMRR